MSGHRDNTALCTRFTLTIMAMAALLGAILTTAGCVTTDDGDMPWASPQGWEGSPFVPGFSE